MNENEDEDMAERLMADLKLVVDPPFPETEEPSDPLDDLRIYTRDPDLVEMRVPEFKHTNYPCLLATMNLGLSLDAPILTDFLKGGDIVQGRIVEYFETIYVPHATDEDLFLPSKFKPYDAVEKAYNLDQGKQPDTELGKYLAERRSPVIILIDGLYQNFSAKAWFCKFWMIAEHNRYAFLKGGVQR